MLLAILTTPIVICIARRLNIVDAPDLRKVHVRPIPRIGGVAIFVSMMGLVVPILFFPALIDGNFFAVRSKVIVLLLASAFMFLVGLADDIWTLRVRTKLLAQLVAAIFVCWAGIRIDSIKITEALAFDFGWFSWPFTIFWIVGICNAINLVDGLDGLAAGICAATCGVIVILTLHFGPDLMTITMLSLLGALCGFLFFNFNPARVFMGDSGSLFLGFTIAGSSVLCAAKTETVVGLALPILSLGIPIFDTLLSMLRRFLDRRSIFSPDRGHFHHRLLALGLRQRHAVIIVYLVTLFAAGLGMFMLVTRNGRTLIVFVSILFLLILAFRVVGAVKLRETITALRRKYAISHQAGQEQESFERIELCFREASAFDQWWQAICFAADKMDFARGLLPITNRDGTRRLLAWERTDDNAEHDDIIKMTIPIRDRRAGSPLNLEIQVHVNGSLESAGRRVTLFGRLLEQYSVANLAHYRNFEMSPSFVSGYSS
jgi:UDP-GlcNAc:undecaprenyl-phosphate GlcNAc-1-phosphate transferase